MCAVMNNIETFQWTMLALPKHVLALQHQSEVAASLSKIWQKLDNPDPLSWAPQNTETQNLAKMSNIQSRVFLSSRSLTGTILAGSARAAGPAATLGSCLLATGSDPLSGVAGPWIASSKFLEFLLMGVRGTSSTLKGFPVGSTALAPSPADIALFWERA